MTRRVGSKKEVKKKPPSRNSFFHKAQENVVLSLILVKLPLFKCPVLSRRRGLEPLKSTNSLKSDWQQPNTKIDCDSIGVRENETPP